MLISPNLRAPLLSVALLAAAPMALTACSSNEDKEQELAELDDNLTGQSDPAVDDALQDKILVDPDLADSSNVSAVAAAGDGSGGSLPSDSGYEGDSAISTGNLMSAPDPRVASADDCGGCTAGSQGMTLGEKARRQAAGSANGACSAKISYGMGWADRMPPAFPVYPKARLQEAAGVSGAACDIRVASFTTSAPLKSVVDYYYTRAKRSGYSAEYLLRDGEHVLGGVREKDDGAYVITLNRRSNGTTAVDLVANNGS